MAGKGKWSLQTKFKRCSGERKCSACSGSPDKAPHGPYYELRRRHPEDGSQQFVYLGTKLVTNDELGVINSVFRGEDPPTRSEVFLVLEEVLLHGE